MYDTTKVVEQVTLERILRIVDELSIFNYYSSKKLSINKPVTSPLRKDNHPSFSLFKAKNGNLLYKDFANGDSGNVVKFVQTLQPGLRYGEALQMIWDDLVSNGTNNPPKPKYKSQQPPQNKRIGVQRKYFTKTDDTYWEQYGLDREILKQYNVSPITRYWINDFEQVPKYKETDPLYAYKVFDKFKIYRPLAKLKMDKWRNNCTVYDIQGFEQLPESDNLLIITKSLKDVMVLRKYGYTSIAPQSENATIPKPIIDHLQTRFKNLIVFFDYDKGGIAGADKLCEKYNLNKVFIPKLYLDMYNVKDISDFRKEMGDKKTKQILKELFDNNKEINDKAIKQTAKKADSK